MRWITLNHSPLPSNMIQAYALLHSNTFAADLDPPGGSSRSCTVRIHSVPSAWRQGAATPEARSRQDWRWGERGRGRNCRRASEVGEGFQRWKRGYGGGGGWYRCSPTISETEVFHQHLRGCGRSVGRCREDFFPLPLFQNSIRFFILISTYKLKSSPKKFGSIV